MQNKSRYGQRGVSASKSEVHNAIKNIDKVYIRKHFVRLYPILGRS